MTIRTPADFGHLIRSARKKQRLDQLTLARKTGVSRLWLVQIEKGKARAEIGLVLRTLEVLGISLSATVDQRPLRKAKDEVDIDRIIASARSPRK
jgi:HTH-type transcriptional regulator / antitoxin HipB